MFLTIRPYCIAFSLKNPQGYVKEQGNLTLKKRNKTKQREVKFDKRRTSGDHARWANTRCTTSHGKGGKPHIPTEAWKQIKVILKENGSPLESKFTYFVKVQMGNFLL